MSAVLSQRGCNFKIRIDKKFSFQRTVSILYFWVGLLKIVILDGEGYNFGSDFKKIFSSLCRSAVINYEKFTFQRCLPSVGRIWWLWGGKKFWELPLAMNWSPFLRIFVERHEIKFYKVLLWTVCTSLLCETWDRLWYKGLKKSACCLTLGCDLMRTFMVQFMSTRVFD